MKKKMMSGYLKAIAMVLLSAMSMSILVSSTTASPGVLIADNPGVSVQGTKQMIGNELWVRYSNTGVEFSFTGINTAAIPGTHVLVNFNLRVSNHGNGDFGLDGLVNMTINPGVAGWNYTLANVLLDNVDPKNHLAAWGETTNETYATKACIMVHKDYIRAGTLVVKVHRNTDTGGAPSVTTCTYAPIDMSTSPPTVPTGCYENDDAQTVHIGVKTTDATGTVAASGVVTICSKENVIDVTFGSTPTVDGIISAGEYTDANSLTFATSGGTCTVYYKHDGTTLYVAFDVPNLDADSGVQVFADTDYDRATAPQTDDYRFTISRRTGTDEYGENNGTGTGWTSWDPTLHGWTGNHTDLASTWNAEFAISYERLNITAGVAKTIGIAFCNCWAASDYYWPTDADWLDPSTWGTASSSDNWARPPVGGVWVPVDKLALLAPYIALASTILVATAATAIYVKRRNKKQ